jgi:hypothetical protein
MIERTEVSERSPLTRCPLVELAFGAWSPPLAAISVEDDIPTGCSNKKSKRLRQCDFRLLCGGDCLRLLSNDSRCGQPG